MRHKNGSGRPRKAIKLAAKKTSAPIKKQLKQRAKKMSPMQTEFALRTTSAADLQTRIRELIKLAKEQGHLTFDDLNEALPEGLLTRTRWTPF